MLKGARHERFQLKDQRSPIVARHVLPHLTALVRHANCRAGRMQSTRRASKARIIVRPSKAFQTQTLLKDRDHLRAVPLCRPELPPELAALRVDQQSAGTPTSPSWYCAAPD